MKMLMNAMDQGQKGWHINTPFRDQHAMVYEIDHAGRAKWGNCSRKKKSVQKKGGLESECCKKNCW